MCPVACSPHNKFVFLQLSAGVSLCSSSSRCICDYQLFGRANKSQNYSRTRNFILVFILILKSRSHIHRLTTKPKSKQRGERASRWFSLAAYLDETWCLFTTANCPMETLALLKTSAETNIISSVVEESG